MARGGLTGKLAGNIAANAFSAFLQLLLAPIYLLLIGAPGVGLIGIYATLAAVLQIFDLGLGITISREIARRDPSGERASVFHTLERVSLAISATLGVILLAAAPYITAAWVKTDAFTSRELGASIVLLSLAAVCRFQLTFYQNALVGAGEQLRVASVTAAGAAAGACVLFALAWRPSVIVYFAWQLATLAGQTIAVRLMLARSLQTYRAVPRWDVRLLRALAPHALRIGAVGATGLILTNLDKIVASRFATLADFGYYTLGATVASGLTILSLPLFMIALPRLTELVAAGEETPLRRFYHRALRVAAVMAAPPAAVLALFARDVVQAWTRSPPAVPIAAPVAAILAVGTALNIMMLVPYALQAAAGVTAAMVRLNVALVAIEVAVIAWSVSRYGVVGASLGWLVINAVYLVGGLRLTHSIALHGEAWRSFAFDLLPIAAVSAAVAGLCRWLVPTHLPRPELAMLLAVVLSVAWIAAAAAALRVRDA